MINVILLVFSLVLFAAGFWCGKRFLTYEAMFGHVKQTMKDWLKALVSK